MRTALRLMSLAACFFAIPVASSAGAADATQAHGHAPPAASATAADATPAAGWPTDAPLREGMARIRQSVQALEHYRHGHMGPEQAKLLAGNVEEAVAFLVANCRLEPAADAALHAIIADLVRAAGALKHDPADIGAIAVMQAAVATYASSFDDPGFRSEQASGGSDRD